MSDEKELKIDEDIPVVNSWDETGGNSNVKKLVKTLPNQNQTIVNTEQTPVVPFSSPSIDFTTILPVINDGDDKEQINDVKPIVYENTEPSAVTTLEEPKIEEPVVEPITEEKPIVEFEEEPIPVMDIPQSSALTIDSLIAENESVDQKENIDIPTAEPAIEQPVVEDIPTVEPAIEQPVVEDIPTVEPVIEQPVVEETIVNPQQDLINKINGTNDIPKGNPKEFDLEEVTPQEIETMTPEEISKNFAGNINKTNNQNINTNSEVSDNTFSNIFDKEKLEKNPINPEIAAKLFKEKEIRTPLDTKSINMNSKKNTKKYIVPPGYGLGIFIFVIMILYIVYIDQITEFINGIIYKLS